MTFRITDNDVYYVTIRFRNTFGDGNWQPDKQTLVITGKSLKYYIRMGFLELLQIHGKSGTLDKVA